MKICWFDDNKLGMVHDGMVYDASAALAHLPPQPYPGPFGDPLIASLETMWRHIETAAKDASDLAASTNDARVAAIPSVAT